MSAVGAPPVAASDPPSSYIHWSAVIGGAITAAGISFTLLAFGAGIGLSVVSTAPTWRDSSAWLWVLSGLFLILVALCAFGFGGYIAGRMRAAFRVQAVPEAEFRDGIHGLVMWGLAILITAVLGLVSAAALTPMLAPGSGQAGPGASTTGENIIATEIDELLRTTRANPPDANNISYRRAEVSRILMKANSRMGISSDERNYLAQIVQDRTGMGIDAAAARTDHVIALSAQELHRARVAAVLQAFMVAAGLLLGAAVAWYAAVEGGRDRQRGTLPVWDWRFTGPPRHHVVDPRP